MRRPSARAGDHQPGARSRSRSGQDSLRRSREEGRADYVQVVELVGPPASTEPSRRRSSTRSGSSAPSCQTTARAAEGTCAQPQLRRAGDDSRGGSSPLGRTSRGVGVHLSVSCRCGPAHLRAPGWARRLRPSARARVSPRYNEVPVGTPGGWPPSSAPSLSANRNRRRGCSTPEASTAVTPLLLAPGDSRRGVGEWPECSMPRRGYAANGSVPVHRAPVVVSLVPAELSSLAQPELHDEASTIAGSGCVDSVPPGRRPD